PCRHLKHNESFTEEPTRTHHRHYNVATNLRQQHNDRQQPVLLAVSHEVPQLDEEGKHRVTLRTGFAWFLVSVQAGGARSNSFAHWGLDASGAGPCRKGGGAAPWGSRRYKTAGPSRPWS